MPDVSSISRLALTQDQLQQRQTSPQMIRVNYDSLPLGAFAGFILAVAIGVIGNYLLEAIEVSIITLMCIGPVIGAALGYASERRRLKLLPLKEREWHERYIALMKEIDGFEERLKALTELAANFDSPTEIDPAVVRKYAAEREALARRLRALWRVVVIKKFEAAVTKNVDGRYRDTRDVSDTVFAHHVRIAHEESEMRILLDESPNEEEFRALEAQEETNDDRVVVSMAMPCDKRS